MPQNKITPRLIRRFIGSSSIGVLVFSGLVSLPASGAITSPSPVDTSNAVRWDPDGSPIGDIVYDFIDRDDTTKKIDAPFPINFYGQKFPALCLSTNGLIYPIDSVSSNCSASFDRDLSSLALSSEAGNIAALALDLDLGEEIHNPHRESTEELQISSIVVSSSVTTVTTSLPHGFLPGERIEFSQEPYFAKDSNDNNIENGKVLTVPTSTTFTLENGNAVLDGTYTPAAGDRAVVFREVVFEQFDDLLLSGTTLTVSGSSHRLGVGRKITFTGTGIAGLDGQKFVVASLVDDDEFTVNVPVSLTDVDSTQAGNQTSMSFSSSRPYVLERDEVGAIQQVYYGTTSVDGRDAYSLTWYRTGTNDYSTTGINGGRFPAVNPETLSITLQLLIIKRSTGSDSLGWDFDYEVNIGHATDASDGYDVTNPSSSCSTSDLTKCRWGIGTARYFPGIDIASASSDGTVLTVNTTGPHNFRVNQRVRINDLTLTSISYTFDGETEKVLSVIDEDTVVLNVSNGSPFSEEAAASGGKLGYSESSELFPNNSVLELRDSAGATALVRNSLNSSVLGRYTFGMVGGQVTSFQVPTMGSGVSGTVPAIPVTQPAVAQVPTLAATGSNLEDLPWFAFWFTIVGLALVLRQRMLGNRRNLRE